MRNSTETWRTARRPLAVASVVALAGLVAGCRQTPADMALRGGAVVTMDPAMPGAQALAIRGDRIVAVGTDADVARWIGPSTAVIELGGRTVLPGFHDTHVHPVTGGIELAECDLNEAAGRDAVVRRVAACAERAGAWVRGGGWQAPIFPGGNAPRALLDSLVADRPAFLSSADGHSAWVNSRALAIAGIDRSTPDPVNGRIERDVRGEPSGTLRESAMDLVRRHMPTYGDADYDRGLAAGLAQAARFGITALHEASASEAILAAYWRAAEHGTLTARTVVNVRVDPAADPEAEVARLVALRGRYGRPDLTVGAKIFVDGVIEGQTAALLADYTDRPGFRGELNVPPERLERLIRALDAAGFAVHLHAIGDRAIRAGFDAFAALPGPRTAGLRHAMAHIQLFDPADIPRFAELGVVASFQPLWAYADTYITDLTEPRLGAARSRWLYPIASVVRTGAVVAAGSDWSVTSMNPLDGIEVAVTRRPLGDSVGPAWIPDERVSLLTALDMYTRAGAVAAGMEDETGVLAAGKAADFVVLDRDLLAVPSHRVHEARVLLTARAGKATWHDTVALPVRR